jgi:predicted methyltransferase
MGIAALSLFVANVVRADDQPNLKLKQLVAGAQRSAAAIARDPARHPYEVLHFFGLSEGQTVVEIWPGGTGYWTEILAPYLRDIGRYYAAIGEESEGASQEVVKGNAAFRAKLADRPDLYGKVTVTTFGGDRHGIAPPGTADLVVTFRNLHNWIASHEAEAAFRAFYKALKPGGVLGIESVGFKLLGSSEVNANPKDTKDYPADVWTLPPTLRLGDVDRAKYEAIGESDRFVLKFPPDRAALRPNAIGVAGDSVGVSEKIRVYGRVVHMICF